MFHVVNGEVKFDYRAQKFRVIPNWFFHFLLSSSASSSDLLLMILDVDVCMPRSEFIAAVLTYFTANLRLSFHDSIHCSPRPFISHLPCSSLASAVMSEPIIVIVVERVKEGAREKKEEKKLLMVVKLHHTVSSSQVKARKISSLN